ncbi:MAG: hypothetical protein JWM25_1636 [Thermoleophilia bacterium]|nr:hypothetical protein [Thermoleophilia bacterium]MCZ4497051.1 hypothetical protein [Thermoleophilia bacterium]
MSTNAPTYAARLLPATGPRPGELLWGDAPRKQPIAPLILMAVVLLLVAAPTALGSGGGTANPIKLMQQLASTTFEITGLMKQSNGSLAKIDTNSAHLIDLQSNMGAIATATGDMATKTQQLNTKLGTVGTAVGASRDSLVNVEAELVTTKTGMAAVGTGLNGSLKSTQAMVREFGLIEGALKRVDTSLGGSITQMSTTGPLTREFASNSTRTSIPGGDAKKFGVPNLATDNRVMAVVLPMIVTMQRGGVLMARKESHTSTSPLINTAMKGQFPDGVNVAGTVRPYDNFYGLPAPDFFVQNRIYGF